ncbi:MAG TPA: YtxH domain-containing protein [Candidatus Polarisedimenticolaceae bacterium]|nr:YtxH domain-containing protein [Candidatus Polarisedimenticolaceae bacterium]
MIQRKHLFIAFATGAAAGAVAAYLTAPRTGKEMRASLQTWARDARDKAVVIPTAIRHAAKAGKEAFAESYRGENGHQPHA